MLYEKQENEEFIKQHQTIKTIVLLSAIYIYIDKDGEKSSTYTSSEKIGAINSNQLTVVARFNSKLQKRYLQTRGTDIVTCQCIVNLAADLDPLVMVCWLL